MTRVLLYVRILKKQPINFIIPNTIKKNNRINHTERKICIMYKEDLRIQKTKKSLRTALMSLLKEKEYKKITVMDICQEALINRMTFYKYYEDKNHLLEDSLETFKNGLIKKVENETTLNSIQDVATYSYRLLEIVINEILSNEDLLIVFKQSKNFLIYTMITDIVKEFLSNFLNKINKLKSLKYPIPLISSFIASGSISLFVEWYDKKEVYSVKQLLKACKEVIYAVAKDTTLIYK